MDGHATSVGGAIVDSGNFDWDANADKFPGLCTPDESYHGLTYTKAFGKMAYITKATACAFLQCWGIRRCSVSRPRTTKWLG